MSNLIILGILIVVMEFAVEGLKKQLSVFSKWEELKSKIIPVMSLLLMILLVLGTEVTILQSIGILCSLCVDYVVTVLICSLGTSVWHDFKKKIKLAKQEADITPVASEDGDA